MISFPKVVSVELPLNRLVTPFAGNLSPQLIAKVLNLNYVGAVNPNGAWIIEPAAGWTVEKLGLGKYKVTHNLGYTNTSLSVNLVEQPGILEILEHSPTEFTVQASVNQQAEDAAWLFSLNRVLSQPAP